jgi:Holliday junction resolvase RusA-like endonuclease
MGIYRESGMNKPCHQCDLWRISGCLKRIDRDNSRACPFFKEFVFRGFIPQAVKKGRKIMKKVLYNLFVEVRPKVQSRSRKGRYGNIYNPKTADSWKETIQIVFLTNRKPLITAPVYLKVHFYFHKAGIHGIVPHTVKPDKDNLEKAVMDALTAIGVWKDDCQVYGGTTEKYRTPGKSGAQIWIETEG